MIWTPAGLEDYVRCHYKHIQCNSYPLEDCQEQLNNPDDGADNPDIDDWEEGEDDGPEDGERDGNNSGDDAIDPEFGLAEQNEWKFPDRVKSMGSTWLSQNIIKIQLKQKH